jgi:hypothetical protein
MMRFMPDRDAARGRAQGYVNEAQELAFPPAQQIAAAPKESQRALLLYCPEQSGWQIGTWIEERGCWLSTAVPGMRLGPTHWIERPPDPSGVPTRKVGSRMSDEAEIARIILAALQNANINFPELPDGTSRNALYRNTEESQHLGRAVLAALKEAGYEIKKPST